MASSLAHRVAPEFARSLPFASPFRFVRELRKDTLGFLEQWSELGGVARFQSLMFVSHLLTEPAAVQHVFQDNPKNYVKEVRSSRIFRVLLFGEGILLAEGETWRAQRRVMQPPFHRQRLAKMTATMAASINDMLERWQPFASSGNAFDLGAETMRLALDVVGRSLLGEDLRPHAEAVGRAMADSFEYFNHALNHFMVAPRFVPTSRNRRLRAAITALDRIVDQVIEHGRARGADDGDLISVLLAAYDTGDPVQRRELRDNISTFLGAGTETTAVALSWAWYMLSKYPEVEARLRAEVEAVLHGRTPAFDDLPNLRYTRMVIDEVLRLYPPAWAITRTAVADDEIAGFRIPAGSPVLASPWVTHRSSRYWENPAQFDPERFTPERSRGRHDYAYYPFGGGPRMCIGDRFSLMEQTLALAMAAQRYRVRVAEDHPIQPDPVFTLRPSGGIRATLSFA